MKIRIRTAWNFDEFEIKGESSKKPSMTVPDQSMTVAELVERNKRGLPLGGGRVPMYSSDPEADFVPDIAKLDLAEIQEMKEQVAGQIAEAKDNLQKIEQTKKNRKMKQLEMEIEQLKKQVGGDLKSNEVAASTNTP